MAKQSFAAKLRIREAVIRYATAIYGREKRDEAHEETLAGVFVRDRLCSNRALLSPAQLSVF
jgi:hypothetical protein